MPTNKRKKEDLQKAGKTAGNFWKEDKKLIKYLIVSLLQ